MLLDISPLCLYHNVPMTLAREKRDPERILDPIEAGLYCFVETEAAVRDSNRS